jgi:hypothetical protein
MRRASTVRPSASFSNAFLAAAPANTGHDSDAKDVL